jgi:tetraacyldisaccharide 4'-kinase
MKVLSTAAAARLQNAITRAWLGRGTLACALWPLSLIFGALVRLRRLGYRRGWLRTERMPVPVIVVGNVVAGGAGKTPLVIALVRHLQARGHRVGVVSRGYGRHSAECMEVLRESTADQVGDEPLLVHRTTGVPCVVARARALAARTLLQRHPDTDIIVCDDGLQHYALHRDIDICVFDNRGAGNGWLLPAGPLREPWPRPVSLVLHSGNRPAFAGFTAQRALAPEAVRRDGTRIPLRSLRGVPLVAVAAIARPHEFFAMLRAQGLELQDTEALPDHYDFDSWKRPLEARQRLICTEKDAVKLWHRVPEAMAVPLAFQPEGAFFDRIDALLARSLSSTHARENLHGQQTS